MSIAQAAQVAVPAFGTGAVTTAHGRYPLAAVMVAIAGAESAWNPAALGDYGLGGPTCSRYGSATSFGLWQIHNVHAAYIGVQAGSTNPCVWIPWLLVPAHNAAVAASVYRSQGLAAWTTYQTGAWAAHLAAAQTAVNAVSAPVRTVSASGPGPNTPAAFATTAPAGLGPWPWVGAGVVAAAAGGYLGWPWLRERAAAWRRGRTLGA